LETVLGGYGILKLLKLTNHIWRAVSLALECVSFGRGPLMNPCKLESTQKANERELAK
jgi:hypothetical protein